jgi:hypothetical protein
VKYFMHDNNLRNQPEFINLSDVMGGRIWGCGIGYLIWEIICEHGDDEFHLPLQGKYDLRFWHRELGFTKAQSLGNTAAVMLNAASAGVIDLAAWNKRDVWAPEIRERMDQYQARQQRTKRKKTKSAPAADSA